MFHTNSTRHKVEDIPEDHGIHLFRFHVHNDPNGDKRREWLAKRPGHRRTFSNGDIPTYMTVALIKSATNTIVGVGISTCSTLDTPSKKLGHELALGRAIKDFKERLQENAA